MKLYVSYGSNMNIKQMNDRCPNAIIQAKGFLEDYKLVFRGKGHANIEKTPSSIVPIVMWQITKSCEDALDIYEGYPNYYTKRMIDINIDDRQVKALTYVMTNEYENKVNNPTKEYYSIIEQGYIDNEIGLSYLRTAYKNINK